jgi:transcriptional/translational regulatory protein YebC/TACO1
MALHSGEHSLRNSPPPAMGTRKWAKVKRQKQKDDQQRSQKWAKLS